MSTYIQRGKEAIAGFIMTLLGGLFIIANGTTLGAVGAGYTYINPEWYLGYYFGSQSAYYMVALGVVCTFFGLLVLTGAILIKMGYGIGGGLMTIIFSTFSAFLGGGFIVGTVFGIIGGILAILER